MRFLKTTFFFLSFFTVVVLVKAQDIETASPESTTEDEEVVQTLQNQFQFIKDKSNSYQEYKVVKITNLNNFWNNVKDSLDAQRSIFLVAQKEIEDKNAALQKLQKEYDVKEGELQKGDYEKAHITVLGMDILKENYIYFNSGIIFLLLIVLAVVFSKYKGSESVATTKKNDFESIDKELNEYRTKSKEREIKIKRELQTEMNRVQELTHELTILRSRSTSQS